ncbi:hypothetical protein EX30DRAFT_392889 [Ascodesmis nigricans]|uniref:N-alpha-acetyltransferase 40 n=1 Tax=Ascodesmis nigricans TaxID=341454 RepID=A0A4S2N892_9PEZI|nr:hypothetical protein EX30DRAFT_392889 [Ascodesmis nigricans]
MESLPFLPTYTLTHHPTPPQDPLFTSLYTLLKHNMYTLYITSILSWPTKRKLHQMRLPRMQYLVLRYSSDDSSHNTVETQSSDTRGLSTQADNESTNSDPLLAAFASFLPGTVHGVRVLYLYELQVSPSHQNRHLGEGLMWEVERRAVTGHRVEKVILTVFSANVSARRFYQRLGYELDACSSKMPVGEELPEPSFYILSKPVVTVERVEN